MTLKDELRLKIAEWRTLARRYRTDTAEMQDEESEQTEEMVLNEVQAERLDKCCEELFELLKGHEQ